MSRACCLVGLLAALMAGCASSSAVPRPFPGAVVPPATPHATTWAGTSIVDEALRYLGTPYTDGGSDPSGFDCSGFTHYVFGRAAITLPRDVHDQFRVGRKLPLKKARPGDLIFFSTTARDASHVGIVVDGGHFVHAPTAKGTVRVEAFTSPYWRARVLGVRRID